MGDRLERLTGIQYPELIMNNHIFCVLHLILSLSAKERVTAVSQRRRIGKAHCLEQEAYNNCTNNGSHFIKVLIATELNQHLLYTRFIANQGDNRLPTDNLINYNSIKFASENLFIVYAKMQFFHP